MHGLPSTLEHKEGGRTTKPSPPKQFARLKMDKAKKLRLKTSNEQQTSINTHHNTTKPHPPITDKYD